VVEAKLTDFVPDDKNANLGTERGRYMLETSLERVGAGRGIVVDKNGKVIAGNKTQEVALAQGIEDAIVVETDGQQLVITKRTDLDLDDPDPNSLARQYAYLDNRSSEVGLEWNPAQIQLDLGAGFDFSAMFRDFEIELILEPPPAFSDDLLDVPKDAQPNPRNLPIDAIYTATFPASCCLAINAGFGYGLQSGKAFCPCAFTMSGHKVEFIDCDYERYDHSSHVRACVDGHPKYATVRDYMSKGQCENAGIAFYELEQVLDWAEELGQYAENVIVIPKVDVLDRIPDKYILGYSVPTSHGGTPLPVEAFRGRRVHLLGGSWKAQLAHMAQLEDDVVSFDNNYLGKIAQVGGAVLPDGTRKDLPAYGIDTRINPAYIALAISLGNVGWKVNELYTKSILP
jgi:hypothetical protein